MEIKIYEIDYKKLIFDSMLVVHFRVENDIQLEINLKIEIFDPFFDIKFIPGEHSMTVTTNVDYWVGFEVDLNGNNEKTNLKSGFRILISDINTNQVLYRDVIKTGYIQNNLRQFNRIKSIDSKICWIIGDSNVWCNFGGNEFRPLDIAGYFPIRSSLTSLTLNRFIKGDSFGYLNSLPIRNQDIIILNLGEIDLRYNIHNVSKNKNIDLISIVEKLANDYSDLVLKIKDYYKVNILVMCPNPPMREGFLDIDGGKTFLSGTELDRKSSFERFNDILQKLNSENGIKFVNWTQTYTCDDGLIDTTKLYNNDHHIKDFQDCIDTISNSLKNFPH